MHLENPIFPKADIRILMTFVAGKNDELGLKADSHLSQISAILPLVRKVDIMCKKFTPDELNKMDHKTKDDVIYQMQDRLDRLEHNYENLVEQIRLADQQRFGRHTEKLDDIAGQLSFFNEAEANYDGTAKEPTVEEVIDSSRKVPRKPKKKGQREEDLKDFPQEVILHDIPEQELNEAFGEENWKSMPDEIFWQLRFEPAKWTAEKHIIKVYVGTDGAHQDEFLRGDHPETMFRGSIATPSLEAAIINAKYVNSNPLDRISRDFQANGLNLSKQTMSNWTVWTAERYLLPVCDFMRKRQLEAHVNQSDETPVDVIHDGRPAGSKSYMWVHITGELSPVPPIIVYEYQKTRHSDHPKAYYKDFDGVLVTDGLEQYHKLERDLAGVKNANCMAHARRHFANAIKAIGKSNPEAVEASVAYKALVRIGAIYDLEGALKELTPEERLNERQASIKPLVEEFFSWLRKIQADRSVLPKSETAKGINYCLNQEAYLKVFLSDGEVPIDNLASERALRTFTIGRKNWMTINTVRGADASAIIYSVTETARANGLNVYYYMKHLLTELTRVVRADGSIDEKELEPLMPWSKDLPAESVTSAANKRRCIWRGAKNLTFTFKNDPAKIQNRDDVITYLIHLGYLGYNEDSESAFVPNEEIRQELITAVRSSNWDELIAFQQESRKLLTATLSMDEKQVAVEIDKFHSQYTSMIQYNDENSLSSIITIAYLGAMQYYFKPVRELPTGLGFADFVFIPKPEHKNTYPALVVELKWNKDATTALQQIKNKKYPESILNYTGEILLVGINYDKTSKEHQCLIEKYEKD